METVHPSRQHILFIFQTTALYSGTNTAYIRIKEIIGDDFVTYLALPAYDELYHEVLTEEDRQRTVVISGNDRLWPRFRRFLELYQIVRQNRIRLLMHSYSRDVVLLLLLRILTGVKLAYYFGAERMGWRMRLLSHVYDRFLVLNGCVVANSMTRSRKLERIPFRQRVFRVVDASLLHLQPDRVEGRPKSLPSEHTARLGYLGRIDLNKGLLELVESLTYLDRMGICASLYIMGAASAGMREDYNSVVRLVERLGLDRRVSFLPASYFARDKTAFFDSIDVFCLPSYSEGSPIVVFEAISHGVPVLATSVGTLPVYFRHGEDILFVKQNDPSDIAAKISLLYKDPQLHPRLLAGMKDFVRRSTEMDIRGELVKALEIV